MTKNQQGFYLSIKRFFNQGVTMKRITIILMAVYIGFSFWVPQAGAMGNISPVTGTVSINNGASRFTNLGNVNLTFSASSTSGSPVTQMKVWNYPVNASTVTAVPYRTNINNWTLTTGDGMKYVYAMFGDAAGNWSGTKTAVIRLDMISPTVTVSVTTQVPGSSYINTPNVTLNLNATDIGSGMGAGAKMQFSDDGSNFNALEPFATTKAWTFSSGAGIKRVHVKVQDAAGNLSTASQAVVTLDNTSPVSQGIDISPSRYARITSVVLKPYATDDLSGVAQMRFSNDNVTWGDWVTYDIRYKGWQVSSGDGAKTVYVQYRDWAGNVSNTDQTQTIILDITKPVGMISINNDGAEHTSNIAVTLSITAVDSTSGVFKMSFLNEGAAWSNWEDYNTTKHWDLLPGTGLRTVYVRFTDRAGNISIPVSSTIYLDVVPVAFFKFDNFEDSSGVGNNGTPYGNIKFDYFTNGNSFADFNGIDDYISIPSSTSLNIGTMTVSYWVKPSYTNYAGKEYTVLNKGNPPGSEYYVALYGKVQGFLTMPRAITWPSPLISAPTNLVAQFGGNDPFGKHIAYISWDDNSNNENGFVIEVKDPGGLCGVGCQNTVPANTKSFKISIDSVSLVKDIGVYAYGPGGGISEAISTQVRFDGAEPVVQAQGMGQGQVNTLIPRDNKWHHVAQTRSATGLTKYYVDGNLAFTFQDYVVPTAGTQPLLIGTATPPSEVASTISISGAEAIINWTAVVGQRYKIQYKEDATDTDWINLSRTNDVVLASSESSSISDNNDTSGLRVYRVLHLDDHAFKGGIDEVMIFNTALSDTDIGSLYSLQRDQFRDINYFIGKGYFDEVPEPQRKIMLDALENLSLKYNSAWTGILPEPVTSAADADLYLEQKWNRQRNFYIEQFGIMESYNVLHGKTANQIIAEWTPVWQAQRNSHNWFKGNTSLVQTPVPVIAKAQQALVEVSSQKRQALQHLNAKIQQSTNLSGTTVSSNEGEVCISLGCNQERQRPYQFVGPTYPFIFMQYYCPTNDALCRMPFEEAHSYVENFAFEMGGLTTSCDPFNCSSSTDHPMVDERLSLSIQEDSRWNVILFDGNFIKYDYDIAAKIAPVSQQGYWDPAYWNGDVDRYKDDRSAIKNRQLGNAPPVWLDWSTVVFNKRHDPEPLERFGSWVGSSVLGQASQESSISSSDISIGEVARFRWIMDYVPENFLDIIPDAAQKGANVIGALVAPRLAVRGGLLDIDIGANINPFARQKAELYCDGAVPGGACTWKVRWAPELGGKGSSWAILINVPLK